MAIVSDMAIVFELFHTTFREMYLLQLPGVGEESSCAILRPKAVLGRIIRHQREITEKMPVRNVESITG
ncbi:hypothetical protein B7P43_G07916 [Cryptotermes secundus]|uniref:Uncharacterized protein n=1 Tax=Cryptotermes secundus TaxID=105785 RepID=A0A2J7QTF8_9NEOP|nr:hypothetical protein B7P43_G07916 [Cryptotermes secundus]